MEKTISNLNIETVKMIEPEIMKKTEKNYEDEKLKCKKIKKICLDIVDSFSESCEMKKMEFFVYKILNF